MPVIEGDSESLANIPFNTDSTVQIPYEPRELLFEWNNGQPSRFRPIKGAPFGARINIIPVTCLRLFHEYFPERVVDQWAKWTNSRQISRPNDTPEPEGCSELWRPTCRAELYVMFAMMLYIGLHNEASLDEYWADDKGKPRHTIQHWMSYKRYLSLTRRFCTYDPTLAPEKPDLWARFGGLRDHVISTSRRLRSPGQNLSVDEKMIKYTAPSKHTVVMRTKPIPRGFKVWVIAQGGFFYDFYWHSNTEGIIGKEPQVLEGKALADTYAIVAQLVLSLPRGPDDVFHVFCDNLFATARLAKYLRQHRIALTGTARANTEFDPRLQKLKADDAIPDLVPWGRTYCAVSTKKGPKDTTIEEWDNGVLYWAFKDKIIVNMLSTWFSGAEAPPQTTRKRPVQGKAMRAIFGDEGKKDLRITPISYEYNMHMGGVDIGDQYHSYTAYNHRFRRGPFLCLFINFFLRMLLYIIFVCRQSIY
jgi:hypothetical protein